MRRFLRVAMSACLLACFTVASADTGNAQIGSVTVAPEDEQTKDGPGDGTSGQDLAIPGFDPSGKATSSEGIWVPIRLHESIYRNYGVELANILFKDPNDPVGGNPEGDVTIVEFFDYNCRFCKNASVKLKELQAEDSGIRIVYKEFPVLGQSSVLASMSALAAMKQERYIPLHEALMGHESGVLDANALNEISRKAGIDMDAIGRELRDPEAMRLIMGKIKANRELGLDLMGVKSTPTFIVGNHILVGDVSLEIIKDAVSRTRAGN